MVSNGLTETQIRQMGLKKFGGLIGITRGVVSIRYSTSKQNLVNGRNWDVGDADGSA